MSFCVHKRLPRWPNRVTWPQRRSSRPQAWTLALSPEAPSSFGQASGATAVNGGSWVCASGLGTGKGLRAEPDTRPV